MKIEELREKSKNLSLVAKDAVDDGGTYQIWSSSFDDKEMHHPTHGVMYVKHVVDHSSGKSMFGEFEKDNDLEDLEKKNGDESKEEEEMIVGRCFVTTDSKSPMTDKVCDLLSLLTFL